MSKIHIKNGTPVGNSCLCETCNYSQIICGYRESEKLVFCTWDRPLLLPFTVCTCTNYRDRNKPDWEQMEKLAIHVDGGSAKPAGFRRAERTEDSKQEVASAE